MSKDAHSSQVACDGRADLAVTRRQLVAAALALSTGAAAGSLLQGCGGGGGGGGGQGRGRLALPASPGLTIDSVTVITAGGPVRMGAGGTFETLDGSTQPLLVQVTDAAGHTLLLGFIDPAADPATNVVGAASTAIALTFFVTGAFMLPPEQYRAALASLAASAAVRQLAAVITAQMGSRSTALAESDPNILAALQQAFDEALPGPGRSVPGIARSCGCEGMISRAGRDEIPPMLLVDPSASTVQSGIQVNQTDTGGKLFVTNNFRRHAHLYAVEFGYIPENGTDLVPNLKLINLGKVSSPQKITDNAQDVSPTLALGGTIQLIGDVFTGKVPFAPVNGDPFSLPLEPNSKETDYGLVAIGPGMCPVDGAGKPAPPLFQDPHYLQYAAPWADDIVNLRWDTFIYDVLVPLFVAVVTTVVISPGVSSRLIQWISKWAPNAEAAVVAADYRGATLEIVEKVAEQPLQAAEELVKAMAGVGKTRDGGGTTAAAAFKTWASAAVSAILKLDTFLRVADAAAVVKDLLSSSCADQWTVRVVKPQVQLNPRIASAAKDQTITLTTRVPPEVQGPFRYHYKTTGRFGTLIDNNGNPATEYDTTQTTTIYKATANLGATDSDTVTVDVYLPVDIHAPNPTHVGTATSTINGTPQTYTLGSISGGSFQVDDNLGVWLNGVQIYYDARGSYAGSRGPFQLQGHPGDSVRIQVQDWYGLYAGIYQDVYIITPGGDKVKWIDHFQLQTPGGNQAIVFDKTFQLP